MKNFTTIKSLMAGSLFLLSGSIMAQTNLLTNGGFEDWVSDSEAVDWKSTNSASNGSVSKSAEARSGAASLLLKGATQNKRLASKEMNLKAGDYTFTFYVKAPKGGEAATARPGHTVVPASGSLGGDDYKYGNYVNDVTDADWIKVEQVFTLNAQTTVNMVVMNGKKPGKDFLIDDASLTTVNGGLAEEGEGGGEVTPKPEQPETPASNVIVECKFDGKDAQNFEFKNVNLSGLDHVWKQDTKGGYLKASAFVSQANHATESWAVSPAVDLAKVADAELTFRHALNFLKEGVVTEHITLLASVDYSGDVAAATWKELTIANYPAGNNWNFIDAGAIDLKEFCGKKVYFAFKYVSTEACAPTWEVDNFKVVSKAASGIASVENDVNAPVEVYNLSGVKVGTSLDGLKGGIYLVKKGNSVKKVVK